MMTPQAFIIPRNATDADIERARPYGAGDRRWTGNRGADRWVSGAVEEQVTEPVTVQHRERTWRQEIRDGLWHAFAAHELPDLWTEDDVMDEIDRQIADEALYRGEDDV